MNDETVLNLLSSLEAHASRLDEIRGIPESEFQGETRYQLAATKSLEIAIDCLIWVCEGLCQDREWGEFSHSEAVHELSRRGALSPEFARRLVDMSCYRNAAELPKELQRIEAGQGRPEKIYGLLHETQYLREFTRLVRDFLANE